MTIFFKTFVNVIKTLSLLSVFNSTPGAQEMAFKATRNMPFSSVLQKLSSFMLAVKSSILCYFVAVILKVLLVNLLAALNFANVFLYL